MFTLRIAAKQPCKHLVNIVKTAFDRRAKQKDAGTGLLFPCESPGKKQPFSAATMSYIPVRVGKANSIKFLIIKFAASSTCPKHLCVGSFGSTWSLFCCDKNIGRADTHSVKRSPHKIECYCKSHHADVKRRRCSLNCNFYCEQAK